MDRPTYIDFLRNFFYRKSEYSLTANEQLLYHSLLMINNNLHWVEWFRYTDEDLKVFTKIGITAIRNARNTLRQYGLIDFVTSKARGTSTRYKICDAFCSTVCTYQINLQTNYKQSTNEEQTNYKPDAYKDNKTKKKTKIDNPPISPTENLDTEKMIFEFTEDSELRNALCDFVNMRKSIKKPLTTKRAFAGVLKKLESLSQSTPEQVEIVNRAVTHNWLTVYELKDCQQKFDVFNDNNVNYDELEKMMRESM